MITNTARGARWAAGVETPLAPTPKKPRIYLPESFPNAVTADASGVLNCSSFSQVLVGQERLG